MISEVKIDEKVYHYLLELFDTDQTRGTFIFLKNADLYVKPETFMRGALGDILIIRVDPVTFKRNQESIHLLKEIIGDKLTAITGQSLAKKEIFPDLSNYRYDHSQLKKIRTPWSDINSGQDELVDQLKQAQTIQDYQNIGNSSRTLMQRLAIEAFDPDKHTPENAAIKVGPGNYKNRLHSIIKFELPGKNNKELREFGESLVSTAEKAVDLANKLTHDLEACKKMAEISAISTISVVNTITSINTKT